MAKPGSRQISSIDPLPSDLSGAAEDALYELLKTGADESPGDDDESTVGTTHLYDEPEDRPEGTSDSPWGEAGPTQNGHPQADHNTDAAWQGHKTTRQGVLDNVFSGRRSADKATQSLMSKNFRHAASGDFTTHSVHLQGKSVEKISHQRTPTIMERVTKLTGRA